MRLLRIALLCVALGLAMPAAHAGLFFDLVNLEPGKAPAPRPGSTLLFGSLVIDTRSAAVLTPAAPLLQPTPTLHLFGIRPGLRSMAKHSVRVHDDGTYAFWVPPGDYLLALFASDEDHDVQPTIVAVIRVPVADGALYVGELHAEGLTEGGLMSTSFELENITTVDGNLEATQQRIETRSGALPTPVRTLLWCTEGVPPGPDPRNARSVGRLDAGCGSTVVER